MVFQFGKIQSEYWESPQNRLLFPFKIETCLEEQFFFYVEGFEVPLQMSVKLAGSETWSFHGNSFLSFNSKDDFCSLLLILNWCQNSQETSPCLQGIVKFFRAILYSLFQLYLVPQTTQERIQNF